MEDLIIDLDKYGPKILADLPQGQERKDAITLDDFALIDEISGLNLYLDNFMKTQNIPETVKDRIRARMFIYSGSKPKDIAIQEMRLKLYGTNY